MRVALALVVVVACASADRPSRTDLPRAPEKHRAERPSCATTRSSPEPALGSVTTLGCTKNADCGAGKNGRCVVDGDATRCVYDACASSSECPGVAVCECGSANVCVSGGCLTDADCGRGGYCSPSACEVGDGVPHFCHTTEDACLDDADCSGIDVCRYQASSRTWRCVTSACPSRSAP